MPKSQLKGIIRVSQIVCTICNEQCVKLNSFPCGNCVESTHSACVGMSPDDVRRFDLRSRVFYCPHCVATSKNVFNYKNSLERVRSERNTTASIENEILLERSYSSMYPEPVSRLYDHEYASLSTEDKVSAQILSKSDAPMLMNYSPRSVGSDGNCMYRAVSLALFGSENNHEYVRFRTAIQVLSNRNLYDVDSDEFVLQNKLMLTSPYKDIVQAVLKRGSDAEFVHLVALSAALAVTIQCYSCLPSFRGRHIGTSFDWG